MKFVLIRFLATNAKQDPFFHLEKNDCDVWNFSLTTKGLGQGSREVADGPCRVTWPSVSSCQPSVSLERIDLSLTESLWKAEEQEHATNLLQNTNKNRIKNDHFWDLSHNLEMVLNKGKDNLGPQCLE